MGKYDPLTEHLASRSDGDWSATFAEVERLIGAALPQAARKDADWWRAGDDAPHAKAWLAGGWHVTEVDVGAETVRLSKAGSPVVIDAPAPARSGPPRALAVGAGVAAGAVSLLGLALALRLKRKRG